MVKIGEIDLVYVNRSCKVSCYVVRSLKYPDKNSVFVQLGDRQIYDGENKIKLDCVGGVVQSEKTNSAPTLQIRSVGELRVEMYFRWLAKAMVLLSD